MSVLIEYDYEISDDMHTLNITNIPKKFVWWCFASSQNCKLIETKCSKENGKYSIEISHPYLFCMQSKDEGSSVVFEVAPTISIELFALMLNSIFVCITNMEEHYWVYMWP